MITAKQTKTTFCEVVFRCNKAAGALSNSNIRAVSKLAKKVKVTL